MVFFGTSSSFAELMESTIQEAIYMFEMKGEKAEAIRLLEKAANNGDKDDKEQAYFYLGKIQELAGNKTSSNFYYQQSLSRTSETAKAYWLSERDAGTNLQPENLQKTAIPLKSSVQAIYSNNPTYLYFKDGSIKKIEDNKLVNIPVDISQGSTILNINSKGIWYLNENKDTLFFKSIFSGKDLRSFATTEILNFADNGDEAIAITKESLYIINNRNTKIQIPEKYEHCQIEGYFKPTAEFILNCSDNALHFISTEDGTEGKIISQFDIIKRTLIVNNHLLLTSANFLYCYQPKQGSNPIWKIPANNVESILPFEKNIVVLEASGRVALIDKNTGFTKAAIRSDASSIHPLAQGTIGLFTSEGAITTVDTLLRPIWNFNFAKPIEQPPIHTDGNIYLYFGERKLRAIAPHYYGKKRLLSDIMVKNVAQLIEDEQWDELPKQLDSLFSLEPGNAEAWLFKAVYLEKNNGSPKEKQKAWSEAVRLSVSNPRAAQYILNRYGKTIGAKFVNLLPISPQTRYPQFFGNKKNLFTIDPAANKLHCINMDNGELRWSKNVGILDESPVITHNENTLAIASGYNLAIFDLNHEGNPTSIQLPGKVFETIISDNGIYVSTWNGFLLKITGTDNKLAWSRKIFSAPLLMTKNSNLIHVSNLEGEILDLDDEAGQSKEGSTRKIPGTVTHIVSSDSILLIATSTNKLYMFNVDEHERPPIQILLEAPITSLSTINDRGEQRFIIGQADQSILLYSTNGAPLWRFQGKNSIFTKPFVKNGEAWIDQGSEVVAISLKDGQITRKFSTPGGAGTPFVTNHTLFSASPKRLLYGFSL